MNKAVCPICDASVTLAKDVQESEIIPCIDCKSRLVVSSVKNNKSTLSQAPQIEEDWGE